MIIKRFLDNKITSFSNVPIKMLNISLSVYSEKFINILGDPALNDHRHEKTLKVILTRMCTCKRDISNKENSLPAVKL